MLYSKEKRSKSIQYFLGTEEVSDIISLGLYFRSAKKNVNCIYKIIFCNDENLQKFLTYNIIKGKHNIRFAGQMWPAKALMSLIQPLYLI